LWYQTKEMTAKETTAIIKASGNMRSAIASVDAALITYENKNYSL
jgi:hypothetical protein